MKLTLEYLQTNPNFNFDFVRSNAERRLEFFTDLHNVASQDLALAHSIFKVGAAKTVLVASDDPKFMAIADPIKIGCFSTHKPFDTVWLNGDHALVGRKHWLSNLAQAEYGIIQVKHNDIIKLCYVNFSMPEYYEKDFSFLKSPGFEDTCTGDIEFNFYPAQIIFEKNNAKYFISNNCNSLCFTINYLGAVAGLLDKFNYEDAAEFRADYKNYMMIATNEIITSSFDVAGSDQFWHVRNALLLSVKNLLARTCQRIITNYAGNFYNLNSQQGRHFFDCLVYSGHNGPISRTLKELYTEPQDY